MIEANGMVLVAYYEQWHNKLEKYMLIVECEDKSSGHIKHYYDFVDGIDGKIQESELLNTMLYGYPPYNVQTWLNNVLD